MKTEKPTVQSVACDIARRIPSMQTDSSLNNEQVIAGLIEPLLNEEANEAEETVDILLGVITGLLIGIAIVGIIVAFTAISF